MPQTISCTQFLFQLLTSNLISAIIYVQIRIEFSVVRATPPKLLSSPIGIYQTGKEIWAKICLLFCWTIGLLLSWDSILYWAKFILALQWIVLFLLNFLIPYPIYHSVCKIRLTFPNILFINKLLFKGGCQFQFWFLSFSLFLCIIWVRNFAFQWTNFWSAAGTLSFLKNFETNNSNPCFSL